MIEPIIFSLFFMFISLFASIEYYKIIKRTKKEYQKVQEGIKDIILSFNRQLENANLKTEDLADDVKKISVNIYENNKKTIDKNGAKQVENIQTEISVLKSKVNYILEDKEEIEKKMIEIDKKVSVNVESQEKIFERVFNIEKEAKVQIKTDSALDAVIPFKRERAIAPLTDTEILVLETLTSQGPITSSEIKDRIKLSREHTARLMKKLYEDGYLERDTAKIPFKYNIKKEMVDLLKKRA